MLASASDEEEQTIVAGVGSDKLTRLSADAKEQRQGMKPSRGWRASHKGAPNAIVQREQEQRYKTKEI